MTPGAIIALVKDVLIIVALAAAIFLLISYGKDIVKVSDMKAVQKQLTSNATTEANWRKELTDANTQRDADLARVAAGIAAQRAPVYVMRDGSARACTVSGASASAVDRATRPGSTDAGSGIDLRPEINRYELRVESVVADCRAALASWPQ